MKYPTLFSPIQIGKLKIRNRIIMPAMGSGTANKNTTVSDRQIAYLTERAKGGCGLIITEVTRVNDETGAMDANQISVARDANIPSIGRLADSVHRYGTAIFVQLHHPGNQTSNAALGGKETVSPSGIQCQLSHAKTRKLSIDEIHGLVEDFATGAERARKAGIDGVELHAAHGYLLNQFLSPYSNRRTDEYGGPLENRARIIKEIILAIRERVGSDYPIIMRISADEFLRDSVFPHDNEGMLLDEAVQICRYLVPFGLDGINVSAGTYETMNTAWEPTTYPEGWKVYLAEAIKKAVNVPVFAVGTIRNPAFAEKILAEGRTDMVCVARGQLADPEWANKAKNGREDEIRRCISCLYCMQTLTANGKDGQPFSCAINVRAAHEIDYPNYTLSGQGRKIVIAGGGPAGMEAARVLSLRGFKVTLIEKNERLGGQLLLASRPPHKEKLLWLVEYYESILRKQNVEIRLNTCADADIIAAEDPYAVFVAAGSVPICPASIPGIQKNNVILYPEVLTGRMNVENKSVVVIGSGMTGLETAEFLAEKRNRISVVEMAEKIGPGLTFQLLTDATSRLAHYPVAYYSSHKLVEVKDGAIVLERSDGIMQEMPAETVVLAMGAHADPKLYNSLTTKCKNVIALGDAKKAGRISDAIHDAFIATFDLN